MVVREFGYEDTFSISSMTERQASFYLNLSMKTLQAWRFQSKGPRYVKLGRSVRYRQVDLDAFINENSINPAA